MDIKQNQKPHVTYPPPWPWQDRQRVPKQRPPPREVLQRMLPPLKVQQRTHRQERPLRQICGHERPLKSICGHERPLKSICGQKRPLEQTRGQKRTLEQTRGQERPQKCSVHPNTQDGYRHNRKHWGQGNSLCDSQCWGPGDASCSHWHQWWVHHTGNQSWPKLRICRSLGTIAPQKNY